MGLSLKQREQLRGYLSDHRDADECLRPFYRYGDRASEHNAVIPPSTPHESS